jgi:hypothetical protein
MEIRHERSGRGSDLATGELRVRKPQHHSDETGIPGGVGGGVDYDGYVIFYVGVPEVEAALRKAESLGGTRRMGPERNPGADLVVGHFMDPEGHLIGLVRAKIATASGVWARSTSDRDRTLAVDGTAVIVSDA